MQLVDGLLAYPRMMSLLPLDSPLPGARPRSAPLRSSQLGAGFAGLPNEHGGACPRTPGLDGMSPSR